MDECGPVGTGSGELYSRRSNTLCVGAGGGILEATTLITALADKINRLKRHVIYRLLVQQGLAMRRPRY